MSRHSKVIAQTETQTDSLKGTLSTHLWFTSPVAPWEPRASSSQRSANKTEK